MDSDVCVCFVCFLFLSLFVGWLVSQFVVLLVRKTMKRFMLEFP